MATLWVRYRTGETDAWRLTDNLAADLERFAKDLMHASAVREVIHFPVVSVDDDAPAYVFGFVSLRMEDVVAWHLEGLTNEATAACCGLKWKDPPRASESAATVPPSTADDGVCGLIIRVSAISRATC